MEKTPSPRRAHATPKQGEKTTPVMEEELQAGVHTVDTGVIRIRKTVKTREQVIDEPLLKEEAIVERVAVNRFVDEPVPIRTEGEVTIIPLLEEVIVVQKKLLLTEELHISKSRKTVTRSQTEVLRKEEAEVEHRDISGSRRDKPGD